MFKKNLTLLSMTNVYVKVTSLAIVPFIARRFTIEEFGVLAMTQSVLGYALDCFDGGIKKVGIRELSKGRQGVQQTICNNIFLIRILLLCLAFIFMNFIGTVLFHDKAHRLVVIFISLSILAQILDITWVYDSRQNMKFACLSKFIERTVFLVVSIFGIYLINMKMLALSFPLSIAVAVSVIWLFARDFPIQIFPAKIRMDYLKEGLVIGFSGIAASLCLTIDQFMIKYYLDTYELGLYCAATKLIFVILTFLWIYSYALFPRLAKSHFDKEEIGRMLTKHTVYLGALGTAIVILLCLFSELLIRLFFSEKFLIILPVFKTLNLFLIIAFFNALFSDSLNAFALQKIRFYIILTALVLNILLNVLFIPKFGLLGAVYSSIMAQLFILVMSYVQIKKIYPIKAGLCISGFLFANLILVRLSFW